MSTTSPQVTALLREVCTRGVIAEDARRSLVFALQRVADARLARAGPIDTALREISKSNELPWVVGAAYWFLRRRENSLPPGTIFTPPKLAAEVISRLIPGLQVVDLGAGTGMLTLAAAKQGFKVTAIEEDSEMIHVLDCLARIMNIRDRIDLRLANALDFDGGPNQQIMANPPYTRHHAIPARMKNELAEFTSRLGVQLPLTAGHHAYFMIYAWTAEWSQREVLLLPTTWLDARYGKELRLLMVQRGLREIAILESADGKPVFDNVLTTACLVTTQLHPPGAKRSHSHPRIRILATHGHSRNDRRNREFSIARLQRILHPDGHTTATREHTLADVFSVRRGVATGSNSFFVLSMSFAHALGIRHKEVRPILRRLCSRNGRGWTEYLWVPAKRPSKESLRRIRQGKRLHIDDRFLCSQRHPWWRIEIPDPPSYFMSYMGRGNPIIRANRLRLLNLNNVHGLYLCEGVSRRVAETVVAWLRSPRGIAALMASARRYQGGFWKLEPGDVERIGLPKGLL